ncbi:[protein-PII] uridylyltransferase [Paucidesulfovibrio longus]|uniref:[protein-PII] uridylyltransferase n=1 Tax=Paucidesulfovibrio longus TaxID=889 RepID=UPI0003B56582|nr:[protein-PII] uridylyltransferase [Paucidesulfovibrio longus]
MTEIDGRPGPATTLGRERERLAEFARQGNVEGFPAKAARLMDDYFRDRLEETVDACPGLRAVPFALVAVGGYGRNELCPASDVDVLLLFKGRIPAEAEQLSASLFHPLWDLGLDLGHGVRTLKDCLSLARNDHQVLASLLDARFIAGDPGLMRRFNESFASFAKGRGRGFAAWLNERNVEREDRYGDSSALLEPDLKNGLGALRDAHQIGWCSVLLSAGRRWDNPLSGGERERLTEDFAFILQARTALHLATGRRTDTLFFDLQPRVAEMRGFCTPDQNPHERALGVEEFLSRLHRSMARIKSLRSAFLRECFPPRFRRSRRMGEVLDAPEGLRLRDPQHAATRPETALLLFRHAAETGLPLSLDTLRLVRRRARSWAQSLATTPGTLYELLFIMGRPHGAHAATMMLETDFLAALIPEFGAVQHLVQFDDYHVHPVGPHTLVTVANLAGFLRGEGGYLASLASEVRKPELLLLAGFFHDLGKSRPGHSYAGAELVREILPRFGVPPQDVEEVAFLVLHHLLLPKTAMRKDLSDESVVAQFTSVAGSLERLIMLHLLSTADSMATGPRAWSSWTHSLFSELFLKARNLFTHGPMSAPFAAQQLLEAKETVRTIAERTLPPKFVARHLDKISLRAFQALPPEDLARHLEMVRRFQESPDRKVLLEARKSSVPGAFDVTAVCENMPGRFARLTGSLTLHHFDILSADVFTWGSGLVVDVFRVSPPQDRLYPDTVWEQLARTMHGALSGEISPAEKLEQMRRSPLHQTKTAPPLPPDIKVDTTTSDFYTILEVAAPDRIGLLHDIARCLERLGIEVHLAKITTKSGRIADIFYVRDSGGMRYVGDERIEELRRELLPVLG